MKSSVKNERDEVIMKKNERNEEEIKNNEKNKGRE